MKTSQIVTKYLKKAKKYRNNDKILTLAVWQDMGLTLTPEQRGIFLKLPTMDTITRRRRHLRSILPEDEKVQDRRYKKFKEMRDEYGSFWKRYIKV